jgi:alpha-2-macroglobulin
MEADARLIPPLPLPAAPWMPGAETGPPVLDLRVAEEAAQVPRPAHPEAAPPRPTPLAPGEAAALLARLPDLPADTPQATRFPSASPPAPRTGATVVATFPPTDAARAERPDHVAPEEVPLEITRISPVGDTELAGQVVVVFSQPMVPLSSLGVVHAGEIPVRLSPLAPGEWQWVDPRTLRFEPERRLPMATRYMVEVPAGTRAIGGSVLVEGVREVFTTPAPLAVGAYPAWHADDGRQGQPDGRRFTPGPWRPGVEEVTTLQPVILVVFDQRVDAAAVLRHARLTADGVAQPLRLATAAEVREDSVVALLAEAAPEGQWLAVRPPRELPGAAEVRLRLLPGTPSAEGPLATAMAQELRFRTYGGLRVESHGCNRWSEGSEECPPGAPLLVRFSNPLDEGAWADSLVQVEPALEGLTAQVRGQVLEIHGVTRPLTTYRVRLHPAIRDRFGQTLGRTGELTFQFGAAYPLLGVAGAPMVVLDPDGPRALTVHTRGHQELRLRLYRVQPEDFLVFAARVRRLHDVHGVDPIEMPGRIVVDRVLRPSEPLGFGIVEVDLQPALGTGPGHAVIVVEPIPDARSPVIGRPDTPLHRPARGVVAPLIAWVQATDIGLAAMTDRDELLAWTTSLRTGEPLTGLEVWLHGRPPGSLTGADGTATLALGDAAAPVLLARRGDDVAILPEDPYGGGGANWRRTRSEESLRWLVFSDRGLYRPGEVAHLKGWLRQIEPGRRADLVLPRDLTGIDLKVTGSRGEEIGSQRLLPGSLGGFHATVRLPEETNLGHVGLLLEAQGVELPEHARRSHHHLNMQEFRRPEYEVTSVADAGPHIVGDTVRITGRAAYYAGGGLPETGVQWMIQATPGHYTPPGWTGWSFGRGPGWRWFDRPSMPRHQLTGTTGDDGEHRVAVELLQANPAFPASLVAVVAVQDVNRQVGSGQTNLIVHPGEEYVGLRIARWWVSVGDSLSMEVVTTGIDGEVRSRRPVKIEVEPVRWSMPRPRSAGEQPERPAATEVCRVTSAPEPVRCSWTPTAAGAYLLTAEVSDQRGRPSRTELLVWVGGGAIAPFAPARPGEGAQVTLVADRREYQPGDTAIILVQSPFQDGEGLMTLRRTGVVSAASFRLTGGSHTLRVPITSEHLPNLQVRVDLVDAGDPTRHAAGEVGLDVPPRQRELTVEIAPRDSVLLPGAPTSVEITVRTADGRPAANAEVAFWAVDESVLAMGGYAAPDPMTAFYPPRYHGVRDLGVRSWVVPAPRSAGPGTISGLLISADDGARRPGVTVTLESGDISAVTGSDGTFTLRGVAPGEHVLRIEAPGGVERRTVRVPPEGIHLGTIVLSGARGEAAYLRAGDGPPPPPAPAPAPPPAGRAEAAMALDAVTVTAAAGGEITAPGDPIATRAEFVPLAVFEPSLRTDANGRVRVEFHIPESLTRYRLRAVAVEGAHRFGRGEGVITARQTLMVRPAPPRFLNFGDTVEIPVVVQNLSGEALDVAVAVRASGLVLEEPAGRRVRVPARDRVELRFRAATVAAGTARLQVAASAGSATDAALLQFPVYTPATAEAFAVYGDLATAAPALLPVVPPASVLAEFGGLDVTVSSTAVQELTDAFLFLHSYPYEGAEQIASRVMATAALRDVLTAFAADGLPPPDSVEMAMRRDIQRLAALQHPEGGWSWWAPHLPPDPFASIHAAHALQRAREKGYAIPAGTLERAFEYMTKLEAHHRAESRVAEAISAYAIYVRARGGDTAAQREARDRAAAAAVAPFARQPSPEALAWLLHALADVPGAEAERESLLRMLRNRATETAGTATFAGRYEEGEHLLLHSDRRSDAVVLEALLATDPRSDLVPRTARGLLAHRVRGRWASTQENAWVLLALERYFRSYEQQAPDFRAGVWWGERFAGSHQFRGRTTERFHLQLPMTEVLRASTPTELTLQRDGEGRMYYRAAMRYAPADLLLPALDRGFTVRRSYEGVDDPTDVQREADGSWSIRSGARVRVRLELAAPARRHHVALTDPIPAGLEPINPELRGTGAEHHMLPPPPPGERTPSRRGFWFTHQNLRDQRAETFATFLPAGTYQYTYLARAVTPGSFVAPPPRAEEMYQPETFGRGETAVVRVR